MPTVSPRKHCTGSGTVITLTVLHVCVEHCKNLLPNQHPMFTLYTLERDVSVQSHDGYVRMNGSYVQICVCVNSVVLCLGAVSVCFVCVCVRACRV